MVVVSPEERKEVQGIAVLFGKALGLTLYCNSHPSKTADTNRDKSWRDFADALINFAKGTP